jgi:F0F1-type ATP synthase membrane subunit b/b'
MDPSVLKTLKGKPLEKYIDAYARGEASKAQAKIAEAEAKTRTAEAEAKTRTAEAEAKTRTAEAEAKTRTAEAETRTTQAKAAASLSLNLPPFDRLAVALALINAQSGADEGKKNCIFHSFMKYPLLWLLLNMNMALSYIFF